MTGPEHYRAAELLTDCATGMARRQDADTDEIAVHLGLATVHARLAQVAATIDAAYGRMDMDAAQAWRDVTAAHYSNENPGARL